MAVTVKNIIDEVRPMVADDSAPYRWSDLQVMARINAGIQEVFSRRPDSPILQTVEPPTDLTNIYDEITLRPLFKTALIYFAAWTLLSERSSDKSLRAQAKEYRQLFDGLMGA